MTKPTAAVVGAGAIGAFFAAHLIDAGSADVTVCVRTPFTDLVVESVADNPPFPGRAYREWITWMYKENRLVRGRMRLDGRRVDLHNVDQNVLVVTAGADHIAPRQGTLPLLDMLGSEDVTHFDRPGGHIGLMAGSRARKEIWPDLAEWLGERSDR